MAKLNVTFTVERVRSQATSTSSNFINLDLKLLANAPLKTVVWDEIKHFGRMKARNQMDPPRRTSCFQFQYPGYGYSRSVLGCMTKSMS